MAADWIKMRGNLWDDPRVSRLCDLTNQSEAMVIGGLYWLWASADQHTEDGVMLGLSISAINRKTGIKKFGEALSEIGWLADHPEGIRIVRFEEHNGVSAKRRSQTAKRVSNHELRKTANANLTQSALANDDNSVSDALAREREEKDIEKKDKTHTQESSPVAPSMAAAVCVLARAKGIGSVNSQNAQLIDLLDQGASIAMFEQAAEIAAEKRKGFAYLLGIVKGQMTEAERLANAPRASPSIPQETPYQRAARERVAEFAPALAKKAPATESPAITIIDGGQNVAAIGSR